jgi:hypothetical protein
MGFDCAKWQTRVGCDFFVAQTAEKSQRHKLARQGFKLGERNIQLFPGLAARKLCFRAIRQIHIAFAKFCVWHGLIDTTQGIDSAAACYRQHP